MDNAYVVHVADYNDHQIEYPIVMHGVIASGKKKDGNIKAIIMMINMDDNEQVVWQCLSQMH